MSENYKFFQHKDCEYFPCHKVKDDKDFNCLFCYCPLYTLGSKCGGNFTFTENGIKNCTNCLIPHSKKGYEYIMSKWNEIAEIANKNK
ncbi:cysteine-rich small domain-containing protein [Hathewaya massiliensis]|uniref:cysteine-rich small domain-containing protein n=1 Tax=Hathewaya massiliensis TaxID=1964382 RepID=UPI0011577B3A|nr:cysteine-rich small domain-containing protein [Hathewaya massiliensis]